MNRQLPTSSEHPLEPDRPRNLVPSMRSSLRAKLVRLLSRPILGTIEPPRADVASVSLALRVLESDRPGAVPAAHGEERPTRLRISIDYRDRWRGREKEVLEHVKNTVEGTVSLLTDEQRTLLEQAPAAFLELRPRPPAVVLVDFETKDVGGGVRVVELVVAVSRELGDDLKHVAIVPNLIQIERQLDALAEIERARDDGLIGPLRALVGLADASLLRTKSGLEDTQHVVPSERLDEHQIACVRKALATPHFAVVHGPPGSGKTTVIKSIIRCAVARGRRVLVVSPTHVAVDNVVEKLAPSPHADHDAELDAASVPLRYAARVGKLSRRARDYWVGAERQQRSRTIAARVRSRLCHSLPLAAALFELEQVGGSDEGVVTRAVENVQSVLCGTPIGILSFGPVKDAQPGAFDLLIVDEVSKMTLPEFLAVAIKAKRWVLVGDPEQLPPHNDDEENATTLDHVIDPLVELACSAAVAVDRGRRRSRYLERLLVVAVDPARAAVTLRAQLDAVLEGPAPSIAFLAAAEAIDAEIVVCSSVEARPSWVEFERAVAAGPGEVVRILSERGVALELPELAGGASFVEPRERAQSLIFSEAFRCYHTLPWSRENRWPLRQSSVLSKCLPSASAIEAGEASFATGGSSRERHRVVIDAIAEHFAVNTVSVYDWLTGLPRDLPTSPLHELEGLRRGGLYRAVSPYCGTLEKQYRMHPSLSRVPRAIFYGGRALHDGVPSDDHGGRVCLLQMDRDGDEGEECVPELEAVRRALLAFAAGRDSTIMVITPYRKQEARLQQIVGDMRRRGELRKLEVDTCTLDRCQGREADYVVISLVRRHAGPFFDMPKRWNVALTRAKHGLLIVGDIDAYRRELRSALGWRGGSARREPRAASLMALIVAAYDTQIAKHRGRARALEATR